MKKLSYFICLALALCLLLPLTACKKAPEEQTARVISGDSIALAGESIATPEEANALFSVFEGLRVPDEALRAYESILRRVAYAFSEENDWSIPAEKDPGLPLFLVAAFGEDNSELRVDYAALEEGLRGKLTPEGEAYLAERKADEAQSLWVNGYLQVSYDELAEIIVRKAAFEARCPNFVTPWTEDMPDWIYLTCAMDLLEEYLHGNKTVGHPGADFRNGPIDPEVRASFESFLSNEAYKSCAYYNSVKAVYDLLEANAWEYDDDLRAEIDALLEGLK